MKYFTTGIFIALLTLTSLDVSAQKKGISIGIETGPGLRRLYGSGVSGSEYNAALGFAGGLAFQYNFSDMFAVRAGASYDLKGAVNRDIIFTDNSGNILGEGDARADFNYFTMPMMFRATFNMNNIFSLFGNAGFYWGYLFKQQTNIIGVDLEENDFDNTDNYKSFDVGTSIGIGANFALKEMFNISIEARNYMGLADISDYESYESEPVRTMSTMLLIGLSHKFGKSSKK